MRFRAACEDARLETTQEALAKTFHVSTTTIFSWRNGDKLPDMENAIEVSVKLGICVEWLLTGRGAKRPMPAPEFLELAQFLSTLPPQTFGIIDKARLAR